MRSYKILLALLLVVSPAAAWGGSSGGTAPGGGEGPTTYAGSPSAAGPANTSLAWDADPAACESPNFVTDQAADGSLSCALVPFTGLSGSIAIGQIPNDFITAAKIAFNYATSASEGGAATDLVCIGCVAAVEAASDLASQAELDAVDAAAAKLLGAIFTGTTGVDNAQAFRLFEADANGSNYVEFVAPSALTSNTTCTLENDGNPIPDSCVGDGSDASGGISGLGSNDRAIVLTNGVAGNAAQGAPLTVSAESAGVVTVAPVSATADVGVRINPKGSGEILLGTSVGAWVRSYLLSTHQFELVTSGVSNLTLRDNDLSLHNAFVIGSNSAIPTGGGITTVNNTSMSNCGAGIWCFGTGADDSSDGKVKVRNLLAGGASSPTVAGSCGTSPSIAGKDGALKITTGTGSPTSCAVTFSVAWATAPVCVANASTTTTALNVVTTTTTVTVSAVALTASETINVLCMGY